ncbi:type I secretion system permease/ATPase [Craurococcus roseus]|uniref:Type I secretion system permease/ATPase n=1 Tax=Craurococcus roseus TaxID=77585 RepID=A0ABP3QT88_9PROT
MSAAAAASTSDAPMGAASVPGAVPRLRDAGVTPLFVATALALTLGAQLGTIGFTLTMMHVTDGVAEARNPDTLTGFALVLLLLVVLSAAYNHLRGAMLRAAAERFGLRLQAVALQAAIRNAVRTDPGGGLAVVQDIHRVRGFLAGGALVAGLELVSAFVALAMLFVLDTGLGLIGTAGVALAVLLGFTMHRATARPVAEARERTHETAAELGGQLVHPDLSRGIGLLPATMLRWRGRYEEALRCQARSQGRVGALLGLEAMLADVLELSAQVFACWLIFERGGTLGLLMGAYLFTGAAMRPFTALFRSWEAWAFSIQSWRRLRTTLRRDGAAPALPPDPDAPRGLSVEAVGFHPPGRERPVLDGVSLHLAPGTVALVEGPNGVGKSTLLRLVLGLMPPTAGRVLLEGQDTWFCDRSALGARLGYLPQDVQLLDGSVFDNIGRGPGAPAEAVVAAARAAGAHEMIGRLPMGYQTPAGASSGLSAGQRRLIGLARALYGDPALLVLDEPELGLDGAARGAMRAAVEAVRRRGGVALVVTHEPANWLAEADLRLRLAPGGAWRVRPASAEPDAAEEDSLAATG